MADRFEYAGALPSGPVRGRGAGLNPANRFESVGLSVHGEFLDQEAARRSGSPALMATQVHADDSRTVINRVDSPDLDFNWTVNPYRGCEHGCIYCYARPGHETLGLSCGVDFETTIFAKFDARRILRRELGRPSWAGDPIVLSGVTDPYQPVESKLKITRQCLEVFAACRQPLSVVTKSRLVLRDLDLIGELARHDAVSVCVSLTSLDSRLAAKMEPRASCPEDRLHTVRKLAEARVPVTVLMAPIVPGLTDTHIPKVLEAAAEAGAVSAGYVLLRLPHQVEALFLDWLRREFPQRANHVASLVRQTRGGRLNDGRFGVRMRGEGPIATHIGSMFRLWARRCGLRRRSPPLSNRAFVRPADKGQMMLWTQSDGATKGGDLEMSSPT